MRRLIGSVGACIIELVCFDDRYENKIKFDLMS